LEGRGRERPRSLRTQVGGLIADLGCGPVELDTAVFSYFIEEHPHFLPGLHLRALLSVRPSDALRLAAALSGRYSAHLTNGRSLPRIPGLEILQVKDYAASA
jgi:hypothetical protein